MTEPQKYTAILEEKIVHNSKYTELHFEFKQPPTIHNAAGQFVMIDVQPNLKRAYSMCDRPDIDHGFELVLATSGGGAGVTYLTSLSFGAEITLTAPLGNFTLDPRPETKQLTFVATGSGIAPIKAMLAQLLQIDRDPRPIRLYWGMYEEQDYFWLDYLLTLQRAFPSFIFTPVVENPTPTWTLSRGRVTDCLAVDGVKPQTDFYLCGNPAMVKDVTTLLTTTLRVASDRIHQEQF